MSVTIQYEIRLLAASLASGACLMAAYDGLRLFRRLIRHGTLWTGIEDVCYWIGSCIVTFSLLFAQNDGVLRWFAISGVLTGMLVYNLSISRILYKLLKKGRKCLTIRKKTKQ